MTSWQPCVHPGGIAPDQEAVVYEKIYALLTRVCRSVTLQRDIPPEPQRQRVTRVQRTAWQILLLLAQHRVCIGNFAASFTDFLRGALQQGQLIGDDLPQKLLLTVIWVCPARKTCRCE